MNNVVAKFGGASMGDAEAISKVVDRVEGLECKKTIVVSATAGTTDQLASLGEAAAEGGEWEAIYDEIVAKHRGIIEKLEIEVDLVEIIEEIHNLVRGVGLLEDFPLETRDRLLSCGERMSSEILAASLRKRGVNAQALDAKEFIFTDNNYGEANVDFDRTIEAVVREVAPLLDDGIVPVVTGFIGQSEKEKRSTLGRGGGDYSASIVAAALWADELQIWTDVDGLYNVDPDLESGGEVVKYLSYGEAAELAYFGVKVLHPKTIEPVVQRRIPVRILNTFNPGAEGTLINGSEHDDIKAVTYKRDVSIINIHSARMLNVSGFLSKITDVFKKYGVGVDVVSTSEVSVSLTVDNGIPDELIAELTEFSKVDVSKNMAIVCLVGEGIKSDTTVLGRLFSGLKGHKIRMVSQGASQRNITFVVGEDEVEEVVGKVFGEFFKQEEE